MKRVNAVMGALSLTLPFVLITQAQAAPTQIRVTVENLAPANSVAFAPLRIGFNNGTFDAFDAGEVAGAPIISIAEGGSGADWFPAFMAADATAVLGTVVPTPMGPLLPGATASNVFNVDPTINPFFTFASMVVPSNDLFIGNDSPTQYRLFDSSGKLNITSISQRGRDIWNAGSEALDPANAAFIMGGTNSQRTPENGVVAFSFTELNGFNGRTTAAGYVFDRQFDANAEIYRITIAEVPEPSTVVMLAIGAGLLGLARTRRRG